VQNVLQTTKPTGDFFTWFEDACSVRTWCTEPEHTRNGSGPPQHRSCRSIGMHYLLIAQLVSLLLDLLAINRRSERHTDLPLLLLRQQERILQRPHPTPPHVSRGEQFILAVLAHKLVPVSHGAQAKVNQTILSG
jgi:hypothetical protein